MDVPVQEGCYAIRTQIRQLIPGYPHQVVVDTNADGFRAMLRWLGNNVKHGNYLAVTQQDIRFVYPEDQFNFVMVWTGRGVNLPDGIESRNIAEDMGQLE